MNYEGILYRPPSEAKSLILQATIGCSHNKCTFCNMYRQKSFRIRSLEEIKEDLKSLRPYERQAKRVFLADGDALMIKQEQLLEVLKCIQDTFENLERIGIYASPKSIRTKTPKQIRELKNAGLNICYVGLESGSDVILKNINKGSTADEIIQDCKKIKEAGLLLSVTLITGLGGPALLREHALKSARAISKIDPDYLGVLTLLLEAGTPLYQDATTGTFEELTPKECLEETALLIKNMEVTNTVFRSNHPSNFVALRGTLPEDKESLLEHIEQSKEYIVNQEHHYRML